MRPQSYQTALNYLNSFAYKDAKSLYPGKLGLDKTAYLLQTLGNPQYKLKVIHVAGTSGKGSTASILSQLLSSNGYKTGTFVSPHILDIRERISIDNKWISKNSFMKHLYSLKPVIEEMQVTGPGKPSYFEILFPIALAYFVEEKVEFAVIETGLGGTLDSTNAMRSIYKTCIITRIGMDHMEVLGNSIAKIATQKAGIIQNKNAVFMLDQGKTINQVFAKQAQSKHAKLRIINKDSYKINDISEIGSTCLINIPGLNLKKILINAPGEFQVENAILCLYTFLHIVKYYEIKYTEKAILKAFRTLKIPGRMHIAKYANKTFIIDAAHNPQKMQALSQSLKKMYKNEKFTVVFALKKRNDYREIIEQIIPITSKLILTSFKVQQDMVQKSISVKEYTSFLQEINFTDYVFAKNVKAALEMALKEEGRVVVTGSIYLLNKFYETDLKPRLRPQTSLNNNSDKTFTL